MKTLRLFVPFLGLAVAVQFSPAQVITTPPQNQAPAAGGTAAFSVSATGSAPLGYQWQKNSAALAGATSSTLTLNNVQPADAGVYTAVVTSGATSASASALLGLTSTAKVIGSGSEVGPNITLASNGLTYDQVLLQGPAATITADPGQITRISYLDLTNDIVQVEFSGAGTLTLVLDNASSAPVAPVNYNQPGVTYMQGHARIVIAGADDTTNVSVFSVGTVTALNQSLFKSGVTYDGLADIASIAIASKNGKFGGVRTANTSYFASAGLTGLYAPGVAFTGPVYVGDISAFATAAPVLLLGSAANVRITGGDLLQANAQPVAVSGFTQLTFADGTTSHGKLLPFQTNLAHFTQNGADVTGQIAVSYGPPGVTVAATKATSDESGTNPGEFTFTRTGGTGADLVVTYTVGGSAINGYDYPTLPGTITIPAGASSVKLALAPNPDLETEGTESVSVTLAASPTYAVGTQNTAVVAIADSPATLYVAYLRPENSAATSTASGVATLTLTASGTLASINVSFSNLSSSEVSGHLRINPTGDFVYNLPYGQVTGAPWTFDPKGNYTATDLLNALKSGNIFVGIDTSDYPGGEVRGTFVIGAGSQGFTAPPAPPAVDLAHATAGDAARFLTQATFGPTRAEIDALTGNSLDAWITAQLALPFTSHRAATLADFTTFGGNSGAIYAPNRQAAWFKTVLTAPDQLRQRVAFALSELFVVSDVSLGQQYTEGLANYYDVLGNGAFGTFRSLLENVTLSPIMGTYLSSLHNSKANPATGTTPDENYAREVMQLFTIGLSQLQPDGTLKLDLSGLPLPTYDQTTITETAKIFTGWAYPSTNLTAFRTAKADYISPMQLYPAYHEDGAKTIVGGVAVPANQGGAADLKLTLDTLAHHPNAAPFLARHLIQRLVTSNPSPAYVYRVAQKYGTDGDLAAMVRAVLTDYEARSPVVAANDGFGKLKEPLLRLTAILRGFGSSAQNGRYLGAGTATNVSSPDTQLAEAALRSPTVFNFFHPSYVLPGALAEAGLVAPEFEITDDTYTIDAPNYLRNFVIAAATGTNAASVLVPNLATEQSLVATPTALLDHLSLVLCGGGLPTAARDRIVTALAALPASTSTLDRARTAVLLVATSPAAATQK